MERAVARCLERLDDRARRAGWATELEPPPALAWRDAMPPDASAVGAATLADRWTAHPPELMRLLYLLSENHRVAGLDDRLAVLRAPPDAASNRWKLEAAWSRQVALVQPEDIAAELARVGLAPPRWFERAYAEYRGAMDEAYRVEAEGWDGDFRVV